MGFDIDKWLTQINDYHIPCAVFVFIVGAVLQWFHHLDANFVAFSGTVLGFLTGHAYFQVKNGKSDSDATGQGKNAT